MYVGERGRVDLIGYYGYSRNVSGNKIGMKVWDERNGGGMDLIY